MPDLTGKHSRETGELLAPPAQHPTLPPGALSDQATKESFVKAIEGLIDSELNIAPNWIKNPGPAAQQIRAGSALNAAAEAILGSLGPNVAAGVAMRYYAGFFEMAKALRYDENADGGGKIVITDAMRAAYMADIHRKAQKDAVYATGVRFGWWGIKRPDRIENVFDNGIANFYKLEYLSDYYRQQASQTAGSANLHNHGFSHDDLAYGAFCIYEEEQREGKYSGKDVHWYLAIERLKRIRAGIQYKSV